MGKKKKRISENVHTLLLFCLNASGTTVSYCKAEILTIKIRMHSTQNEDEEVTCFQMYFVNA